MGGLGHLSDHNHQLFGNCLLLSIALCQKKDNLVHTNPNCIPPLSAKKPLLQPRAVQLHLLLLLLLGQGDDSLFVLPLLPLDALYCYSCYLNKAMLTTKKKKKICPPKKKKKKKKKS